MKYISEVYILESTTNLASGNWIPVYTNSTDTNGNWTFTDTSAVTSQKFYRVMLSP